MSLGQVQACSAGPPKVWACNEFPHERTFTITSWPCQHPPLNYSSADFWKMALLTRQLPTPFREVLSDSKVAWTLKNGWPPKLHWLSLSIPLGFSLSPSLYLSPSLPLTHYTLLLSQSPLIISSVSQVSAVNTVLTLNIYYTASKKEAEKSISFHCISVEYIVYSFKYCKQYMADFIIGCRPLWL